MSKTLLFAIDTDTKEVIVSNSSKGSYQVNTVERIKQSDNIIIYNAVQTLTSITKSTNFDEAIFKSMDKVCQMLYQKHKEPI